MGLEWGWNGAGMGLEWGWNGVGMGLEWELQLFSGRESGFGAGHCIKFDQGGYGV